MPIQFAGVRFIQRSQGNSATRVAAYNARTIIVDDRTGERHDFRRMRGDLEHHEVMLPDGADPALAHAAIISNMSEAAEKRKDARVGREFVLALPAELDGDGRLALARSFAKEHFADKGLAVQIDIHRAHEGSVNVHAHYWVPMRRIDGDRLAARQATDLLPTVRTSLYGVFVAEADRWGQLWGIHQSRFFRQRKLDLAVDPIAIHPGNKSYGPRRSWGPRTEQLVAEQRQRNQNAARVPEIVWQFAKQEKFDSEALRKFLAKWLPNDEEREHVRERIYELRDQELLADKVGSGWRPLTIEDLALADPDYAELAAKEKELREQLRKLDASIAGRKNAMEAAEARAENRWRDMNLFQKGLHLTRIYRDIDIEDYESRHRRAHNTRSTTTLAGNKRITDWGAPVKRKDVADKLKSVTEARKALLETLRPEAERELARRQKINREAKQTLVGHTLEADILKQRRSTVLRL